MIDAVIGRSTSVRQESDGSVRLGTLNEIEGERDETAVTFDPRSISLDEGGLDLLLVSRGLLWLEERLKRGKGPVRVTLHVDNPNAWSDCDGRIVSLLQWLLRRQFAIRFRARPKLSGIPQTAENRLFGLALYSGGVDSTSGLLWSKSTGNLRTALYINHQPMLGSWVESRGRHLLDQAGIPIISIASTRTAERILQLRGFLYAVAGMVVSSRTDSDTLDINECGVTMYQPPLLPNDIVTVTTNPRLISSAQAIVKSVIQKSITVRESFENLTKAEVIAISGQPDICELSMSCISNRFVNAKHAPPECGHCWGCVIKKTGATAAQAKPYAAAVDVIRQNVGDSADRGKFQTVTDKSLHNLALLIDFSTRALSNTLPWWTKLQIERYGKEDLFERFALDTFLAFRIAHDRYRAGTLNTLVSKSYTEAIGSGIVSKDRLDDRAGRLSEVRTRGVRARLLRPET